ncbi:hypothetical protein VPHD479_0079 [Vibrio phage D479]
MFIEMSACGYYSNQTESQMVWLDDGMYEKYENQINHELSMYFYELDGKHSETQAELAVYEYLEDGLRAWHECTGSDHLIEHLADFMSAEDVTEMEKRHREVTSGLEFVTTLTCIMNGVEIRL